MGAGGYATPAAGATPAGGALGQGDGATGDCGIAIALGATDCAASGAATGGCGVGADAIAAVVAVGDGIGTAATSAASEGAGIAATSASAGAAGEPSADCGAGADLTSVGASDPLAAGSIAPQTLQTG